MWAFGWSPSIGLSFERPIKVLVIIQVACVGLNIHTHGVFLRLHFSTTTINRHENY